MQILEGQYNKYKKQKTRKVFCFLYNPIKMSGAVPDESKLCVENGD